MKNITACTGLSYSFDYFMVAAGSDTRAYQALQILDNNNANIGEVLLFEFSERDGDKSEQYSKYTTTSYKTKSIKCSIKTPSECIKSLINNSVNITQNCTIGIDISCFNKPYFYVILKYLRDIVGVANVSIFYTEPSSYVFNGGLISSYHSTSGPLTVMEIPGYSGEEQRNSTKVLVTLLGFDGELSSFITDEISPDKTVIVNGFPGYSPKFKDVSLINNEKLVGASAVVYARANNPFEVYNTLTEICTNDDHQVTIIAPLGTKPMALGACLFAINNESVRVVYPMPDRYEPVTTNRSWNSWVYEVPLSL